MKSIRRKNYEYHQEKNYLGVDTMKTIKNSEILAMDINKEQLENINEKVKANSKLIDEIVTDIVNRYCKPLDDYMRQIDDILIGGQTTAIQLDDFALNLPVLLYFISDSQESLGIKEDVSRAVRQELYNTIRDDSEGTVADKDSLAELGTQYETLVNVIYSRAYKKFKARVEAGYEMLASVKKVMTRRITEMELTKLTPENLRGL